MAAVRKFLELSSRQQR